MNDILLSSRYRPTPEIIFESPSQIVIHGAFKDVEISEKVDGFIFDTPGVSDETSYKQYRGWMLLILRQIEILRSENAVLILLPRDRKGGTFLKSLVTADLAQAFGWEIFRHYFWDKGPDFHRARYPHQSIYVFRKGDMPTRSGSPIRYKDIIRMPDLKDPQEGTLAELPVEIPRLLLSLFDLEVVVDPFAGSGSTAEACDLLRIARCYSIELNQERSHSIKSRIISLSSGAERAED